MNRVARVNRPYQGDARVPDFSAKDLHEWCLIPHDQLQGHPDAKTPFRVALFAPPTPEYPITLLQEHRDALLTATIDTARHPIGEHPEWDLGV